MLSQINLRSAISLSLIVLVCLWQITVMPYFAFAQAVGNLILVAMIILMLKKKYLKALFWAILGGLFLDFSLGLGLGPYFISFIITFLILFFWLEKVFSEDIYLFALINIFVVSLIFDVTFILIVKWMGQEITFSAFWLLILKQAVYNLILLAIIYPGYHYFEKKLFPRSEIELPQLS